MGNLSWNTVEDTIWDAFSEYGEVTSVRLPTDRESGKPKGYGYIEFSAVDSAQKAISAMNGQDLDGRLIRLDFSQPRDANGAGRGRGTGRGRGGFDGGTGRGRGGFDGGRGRGGGRVRHFTLFQILHLDYIRCRAVAATAVAVEVGSGAECGLALLLPLKAEKLCSNIILCSCLWSLQHSISQQRRWL